MNNLYGLLAKIKYVAVLVTVAMLAWLICWRWDYIFHPAWIWIVSAVVVTLVVIVVIELVRRSHEKKMAEGLATGIASAEGDKIDLKGEIKALRDTWSSSLDRLRSADAGSGRTALYRLPWYMIIGEPAAGKSTLLRKSGLDFPIGDASVRGLHGTRNCDWWFSNDAIFLDTAGRYIIETQDEEWVAFLNLLGRYRKKKPISGVLVAVAANSLLTKTHDELLADGKRIRTRVDELIDVLGVNFPVYVLVTKVDLVSGFVEFFGPLDPRYREQMVGWTLPMEQQARFDAATFDVRFGDVTNQLYRMRPWLESKVSKRDLGKAFLFPEEFSYLGDPLKSVLEVVFKPNVYQETPVCRGVYFSSGTQVGSPLARALEDMARDLHIPADFGFGTGMEEEKEVRAYFIRDLVSDQVLADREMTWRTGRAEVRAKKRRTGWGLMGVGVALLLALFTSASYVSNRKELNDFKQYLPAKGKPLEVAVGTLKARENTKPSNALDLGLNYSGSLNNTIQGQFGRVVSTGLILPWLGRIESRIDAPIPVQNGRPDLDSYLTNWRDYQYVRNAVTGKLSGSKDPAALDAFLHFLRGDKAKGTPDRAGSAGKEQLRDVLDRFSKEGAFAKLDERDRDEIDQRMKKVESSFSSRMSGWLTQVGTFAKGRSKAVQASTQNDEAAVAALRTACTPSRIQPHKDIDALTNFAADLRTRLENCGVRPEKATSSGGSTSSAPPFALGQEPGAILGKIAEELPPGSDVAANAAKLEKRFKSDKGLVGAVDVRHDALVAVLDLIDDAVKAPPKESPWSDPPTRDDLNRRMKTIEDELDQVQQEFRSRLLGIVAKVDPDAVKKTAAKKGTPAREELMGWAATIPLLARAYRADVRKKSWIEHGLDPWFGRLDQNSFKVSYGIEPSRAFSFEYALKEIVDPLSSAARFLEVDDDHGLVARDIAAEARDRTRADLGKWRDAADKYWLDELTSVLGDAPQSLGDVSGQLDSFADPTTPLQKLVKKLGQALAAPPPAGGEKPDSVRTEFDRIQRGMSDRWAICLTSSDASTLNLPVIANRIRPFRTWIQKIAPFGSSPSAKAARKLAAATLNRDDSAIPSAAAVASDVLRDAQRGSPRQILGTRLNQTVKVGWYAVLDLAKKDIAREWDDVRRAISYVKSPADLKREFGPTGHFATFREKSLAGLFDPDSLASKEPVLGGTMKLDPGFQAALRTESEVWSALFTDPNGTPRQEHLSLSLGLGTGLRELVVVYQPRGRPAVRSGPFTNFKSVTFSFDWSPLDCTDFHFEVKRAGENQTRTMGDEKGPWAVAAAFVRAGAPTGGTYKWKQDSGKGREVWLTVGSGSDFGLVDLYRKYAKEGDPVSAVVNELTGVREVVSVKEE